MAHFETLCAHLSTLGRVVLGYSGGVDSGLLAVAARQALGRENFLAVTGRSASYPAVQAGAAVELAQRFDIPLLEVETHELEDPRYLSNSTDRCYFCKSELWARLHDIAGKRSFDTIIDGTNADDLGEHRPGMRAAAERDIQVATGGAGLDQAGCPRCRARAGLTDLERARRALSIEPGAVRPGDYPRATPSGGAGRGVSSEPRRHW